METLLKIVIDPMTATMIGFFWHGKCTKRIKAVVEELSQRPRQSILFYL